MSVSLVKEYGISFKQETGMERADWDARVMLPMYLTTVYPHDMASMINLALKHNDLRGFSALMIAETHYDNSTGKLV